MLMGQGSPPKSEESQVEENMWPTVRQPSVKLVEEIKLNKQYTIHVQQACPVKVMKQ